jgi:glycosyltransferase involved in cell wall biosynthesis
MNEARTHARKDQRDRRATVSIVIPCLNEANTIGAVVDTARAALSDTGIPGEVVVADNGSGDNSKAIAAAHGARVVEEHTKGYGSALRRGCDEALGSIIVMGDADESYDFGQLGGFLDEILGGADLVMGTRTRGTILPGAMPWKNRYIGNPVSTGLLNRLFRADVSDVHCGMRAFTKDAYRRMDLRTTGMEFASEMVIRASLSGMEIREVPITFQPDGRGRKPHLRPWRDGWRHLKTILLFSPSALFLIPGVTLIMIGLVMMTAQLVAPVDEPLQWFGFRMDFHWAILGSLLAIVGYQIVLVDLFAKLYAMARGIRETDRYFERAFRWFTLERVLAIGAVVVLVGLAMDGYVAIRWLRSDLGPLVSGATRLFILGSTLIALGVQTIFSACFLSILRDDYAYRTRG